MVGQEGEHWKWCFEDRKVIEKYARLVWDEWEESMEDVEKVLEEFERELGVKSMANERAANGMWPSPKTPEDYLAWIEDEAGIHEHYIESFRDNPIDEDDIPITMAYADRLREMAQYLRSCGMRPSPLPWQKKEIV